MVYGFNSPFEGGQGDVIQFPHVVGLGGCILNLEVYGLEYHWCFMKKKDKLHKNSSWKAIIFRWS